MSLTLPTDIDVSEPDAPPDALNVVNKSISVDPEVWTEARLKSIRNGQSLSEVIRDFLKRWVEDDKSSTSGVE